MSRLQSAESVEECNIARRHIHHVDDEAVQYDEEQLSCLANGWRSIATHTAEVASELTGLLGCLLATSYTRGVLRLLEHHGPFRLAFFEAVFRAADIRASILAKTTERSDTHA